MTRADEEESRSAEGRRYLTFRMADRLYALPAESVAEVIRIPSLARVPQAPKALLGVANLRGAVLPLASLRALLGLEENGGNASRAIVLDGEAPFAITVDSVDAIVLIPINQVETDPAHLGARPGERLNGVFPLEERLGSAKILDIQGLLASAFAQHAKPQRTTVVRGASQARSADEILAERQTLVTFEVADQEFALDLGAVQEILALPDNISSLPHAEGLVLGMMGFRDQLLPLLSLRGLLGFEQARPLDKREKIVVALVGGALVGLVADSARAIVSADVAMVDPVPPVLAARAGGEARIKSIYRGEQGRRLISIIAPEQLFREDVMQRLGSRQFETRLTHDSEGKESELKFLVFRLGDDEFGLPIEAVDEVARVPDQITRVPKTPKFLEGVVNLRGEVLPVVDQRRRFDMPPLEREDGRRLIVVRTERHRAGLIVDSVSEVLGAAASAVESAPDLTGDITRLVRGVISLASDNRIVLLLDPAELLTRAERGLLDAFERKPRRSS
jgi:purine-binding chemotaxis protein CheW